MWCMPIFSFIGYTVTELFRKSDNWRQIYKRIRLFIRKTMRREEKIPGRHNKVAKYAKQLFNYFKKKNTEAATGGAEAITGGVLW